MKLLQAAYWLAGHTDATTILLVCLTSLSWVRGCVFMCVLGLGDDLLPHAETTKIFQNLAQALHVIWAHVHCIAFPLLLSQSFVRLCVSDICFSFWLLHQPGVAANIFQWRVFSWKWSEAGLSNWSQRLYSGRANACLLLPCSDFLVKLCLCI